MDKRVKFDFEIAFTNGGGIRGQDFRLDLAGEDISDRELADYLVQDMRLLMVGKVTILNKTIFAEPHKRRPFNAAEGGRRLVDLSHRIWSGLVTYKGLPAPLVCDYLSREASRALYAPGTEFQIAKIEMVANTGTYLDCPFHRYAAGKDLAGLELAELCDLDGIVVRAPHGEGRAIGVERFKGLQLRNRAVLVHTGWDRHWNSPQYHEGAPFLTRAAAAYLQECGVGLVGIDSLNIDDTGDGERPAHSILLGSGILIVEHLCHLELLPDEGFTFSAVPPRFEGVGTFPVRAFARLGGVREGLESGPA